MIQKPRTWAVLYKTGQLGWYYNDEWQQYTEFNFHVELGNPQQDATIRALWVDMDDLTPEASQYMENAQQEVDKARQVLDLQRRNYEWVRSRVYELFVRGRI